MIRHLLRRHFLVLFGAFFLCAGIGLLVTGILDVVRERRFETTGVSVNAVVVSKSIARATRDGTSSTRYEIAYRFRTDDGRPVEGVDAVDVEEWERLAPGRPFTVTYLPAAPEASRAQGSGGFASALIMTGIGVVFTLVGGLLFVTTGRGLLRSWRLLREGQPARGTVIDIRETNVYVNKRRQWEIRYRYEDHVGRAHEGTSGPLPAAEANAFAAGEAVDVRFDREAPEHSVWVPPVATPSATPPRSRGLRVRNVLVMLAIVFAALVIGERVPALKALDQAIARHEGAWLALAVALTFLGFALFMGAIISRVFFGPSSSEKFTLAEARAAWRRRAWRRNARWRTNFLLLAGVMAFMVGLFGVFAVLGPAGIKLLVAGVIGYVALRTIVALARSEEEAR